MALFGGLSERLNHIFSKLTKRGKLTELEIRTAMREVRVALLEADVNLRVAKQYALLAIRITASTRRYWYRRQRLSLILQLLP